MDFNGQQFPSTSPDLSGDVAIGGDLSVGGVVELSDGTISAPSLTYSDEKTTGWAKTATKEVSYVTSGAKRVRLSETESEFLTPIAIPDGSSGIPALSFSSDPSTGLFLTSPDTFTIQTAGIAVAEFSHAETELVSDSLRVQSTDGTSLTFAPASQAFEMALDGNPICLSNGFPDSVDLQWFGKQTGTDLSFTNGTFSSLNSSSISSSGFSTSGVVVTGTSTKLQTVSSASTYTPALSDGAGHNFTASIQVGQYYKIGHMYFVSLQYAWSGKGSAVSGNQIQVSLPTTIGASMNRAIGTIGFANGIGFTGSYLACNGNSGQQYINFFGFSNLGAIQPVLVSQLSTSGELQMQIIYWDN